MRFVLLVARAYPTRTAVMLVCLLLAGAAEGISVAGGVPLITLLATPTAPPASAGGVGWYVSAALRGLGLAPTVGVLLLLVASGVLVRAVLVLLANKQVGYTVAHMATDLRLALIRAVLRSRWEYYVHQPLGTFASAVASEARRAADAYLHATTLVALLIQAVAYVVVACLVSWRATLVTLAVAAAIVTLLTRFVRTARRAGRQQTRVTQSLLKRLTDTLQSVKPLKAMGQEALVGPLLEAETRQLNRALRREVASKEAMNALQDPLMIGFLAIGLYTAQSRLSLPLATVIILAIVCGRIVGALGNAQKEFQRMAACESAFWSLQATIAAAEAAQEHDAGSAVPALERAIELRDVRFAYDGAAVLDSASLVVPAGELTAIVGPSGAGKTTVADLIIGLLRPQAGDVLIDDVQLQTYDAQRWRALIGYVPQDTFLLHDTIGVNVTLGDRDLSPAEVQAALRAAGAWDFIAALPDGIDTVVGERGLRLSGGQRQRIALARALVRQPQLLILDEATAALDPVTEAEVCNTLQQLRGAMTILAICHKGLLIAAADHVYRVEAGRITPVADRSACTAPTE
ncbi:MAG TPA: ABC transporter ATP-binding protein [Candidatus Margulisiibacteriota bacterium]|nr:ABC transporter ATP-binding protein [Candidatus Margulisiibacteriota bacterium]